MNFGIGDPFNDPPTTPYKVYLCSMVCHDCGVEYEGHADGGAYEWRVLHRDHDVSSDEWVETVEP